MQLPIDERILEPLAHGFVLLPAVIALNIDKSRSVLNRCLSELVEIKVVERVKRGYYGITDAGERYLSGDLDPNEL